MNLVSVIVPLLNEEVIVKEISLRLRKTLIQIPNIDYEVIFIDDGSTDKTWKMIEIECSEYETIKGIKLSRNFGHHYAITSGMFKASGDWVVVMDGDLQDRPEVIPRLFEEAQRGFDIVFVSRLNRNDNKLYLLFQKLFYKILKHLSGVNLDPTQANFSIISRKVVDSFKNFPEKSRYYATTINWLGFSKSQISAEHGERFGGNPSYTLAKRINLALDIILAFSIRPLKVAIILGVILSLISIVFGSSIVVNAYFGGLELIGIPTLITTLLFSTGIVLVFLGILGVYLGKVFEEVKNRPLYIIDTEINFLN